jgi:hypothetical protein
MKRDDGRFCGYYGRFEDVEVWLTTGDIVRLFSFIDDSRQDRTLLPQTLGPLIEAWFLVETFGGSARGAWVMITAFGRRFLEEGPLRQKHTFHLLGRQIR